MPLQRETPPTHHSPLAGGLGFPLQGEYGAMAGPLTNRIAPALAGPAPLVFAASPQPPQNYTSTCTAASQKLLREEQKGNPWGTSAIPPLLKLPSSHHGSLLRDIYEWPSLPDTEADREETDQRSKAEESASGQALVATDGHYLEALSAGHMRETHVRVDRQECDPEIREMQQGSSPELGAMEEEQEAKSPLKELQAQEDRSLAIGASTSSGCKWGRHCQWVRAVAAAPIDPQEQEEVEKPSGPAATVCTLIGDRCQALASLEASTLNDSDSFDTRILDVTSSSHNHSVSGISGNSISQRYLEMWNLGLHPGLPKAELQFNNILSPGQLDFAALASWGFGICYSEGHNGSDTLRQALGLSFPADALIWQQLLPQALVANGLWEVQQVLPKQEEAVQPIWVSEHYVHHHNGPREAPCPFVQKTESCPIKAMQKKKKTKAIQGVEVPTWGQLKKLTTEAQQMVEKQEVEATTSTMFLLMLALLQGLG
ncbi:hypothetical protein QTO34_019219 [Cnephaeus nilssonii]|uniref:Uncharacterized protein n=1 Tax=Cnephaeus nilssonii TaxID=3371016 RepID=A0AA40LLW2_CNENI|nr:hypothetical protein QTO34_019219 [Eptesicus nilssonii]